MTASAPSIANKHTDISVRTKQIVNASCPDCRVYIATYRTGTAGQEYQQIEQGSGEDFWSIKAWSPPPHHRLKDPDLVVTHGQQVRYMVEIKWGAMPKRKGSDLLIDSKEQAKIQNLLQGSVMCRVRGPAIENRRLYKSHEFQEQRDYWTNTRTQLLLVSDFGLLKELSNADFQESVKIWKRAYKDLLIADIRTRVDEIPSLVELMEAENHS